LKIDGDHGGGTFKATFQIANVLNPNQPNNAVIFSMMEAKDYKSNLLLCLERFKAHIAQFNKVKWEGDKTFRLFLFGDYEFLCAMYGLSGAAGRHPCLWCEIPSDMLKVRLDDRICKYPLRTLESLDENLLLFREQYGSNIKKALLERNPRKIF